MASERQGQDSSPGLSNSIRSLISYLLLKREEPKLGVRRHVLATPWILGFGTVFPSLSLSPSSTGDPERSFWCFCNSEMSKDLAVYLARRSRQEFLSSPALYPGGRTETQLSHEPTFAAWGRARSHGLLGP